MKGHYEPDLIYSKFVDPPNQYRSFTFYSVNDKLEMTELKRQIHHFKAAGFGGFYFHSREGLLTPYLQKEWWQAVDTAVAAALDAGVEIRFYDEDRWPSGFAGGAVPLASEDFRAKSLVRLSKDVSLPKGADVLKEDDVHRYVCYTAQLGNPLFNGTSYVDLMNPETVATFIHLTHQQYFDRYKSQLPYPLTVFSDEPHIHARYFDKNTPNEGIVSYSPVVRKRYEEMYGSDLMDKVNLLFEEKDNWREVRWQYYTAVAAQFEISFSAQMGQYMGDHNGLFVGHYLGEDVLTKVRDRIGNSMLHYRNMQIPGIDMLGMATDDRLITARRMTSVANQYGIPRRMSELFGISGHNMNFQDRKRIANWHAMNGINHLVPHLTQYSLTGLRKRDYPPTFSEHQPYWPYNKLEEDYQGRISYAATVGEYQPQVLVLSPLESEFIAGSADAKFTKGVSEVLLRLQAAHFDYDIGDEQILADIARVKDKMLEVGAMHYSLVIIPDMIEMRKSTLDLLVRFLQNGGKVAHLGKRFPSFLNGILNEQALSQLQKDVISLNPDRFKFDMQGLINPEIQVGGADAEEIWVSHRQVVNGHLVMLMNQDMFDSKRFFVQSRFFDDNPVLWQPESVKCYTLTPQANGWFEIELAPSSLVWITTGSLSSEVELSEPYHVPASMAIVDSISGQWSAKRLNSNAMTLDFASYSTDGGLTYSDKEPVIGIHERLTDAGYNGPLMLHYEFEVKTIPLKMSLVVEESMTNGNVRINGHIQQFCAGQHYIDAKFLTKEITRWVNVGVNSVDVSLIFKAPQPKEMKPADRYGTEIESIYLMGDFGVFGKTQQLSFDTQRNWSGLSPIRPVHVFDTFFIDGERDSVSGSLTDEGYPFYAGAVELTSSFTLDSINSSTRYVFNFPDYEAIVLQVEINGNKYAPLVWMPYKMDVTSSIHEGENRIKITLVNSLRNLLGPHHHVWKEMNRVGPATFSGKGGFPNGRGNRDWYDLRVKGEKTDAWNDNYYMVPFGLLKPVEICTQ
jgi:hypothetical protein